MKNQCKPVSRGKWLALLLSALLLLGMLPVPGAVAETTGALTVKLKADTFGRLKDVPEITLYQIGDADQKSKSGWSIYTEYSGYGILSAKTSEDLGYVAKKIAGSIAGSNAHKIDTLPMTGGEATFDNLKLGVYFGMVTGVPAEVEVTPFIVTIPSRDPATKELRYKYDVTAKDDWITSATVVKQWQDGDDQDGIRPQFIEVTLSNTNGQKVRLDNSNNWTATIDRLPMYANGKAIDYTWAEALVDGYLSTQVKNGVVTTLTNVHKPETVDVTVRKVWQDEDNAYGIRPEYVEVTLSTGQKVTLNAANQWTATVSGLPKYNRGQLIEYTWTEAAVNGYELASIQNENNVTTLTNVLVPTETPTAPVETPTPTTQVTGKKVWLDDSNAHKTRPSAITVTLYADGAAVNATPTWSGTGTDTWTYTFANLPAVNANGDKIAYTVKETPVEGYETEVDGTTIINKLIPKQPKEYKELTGQKTWQEVSANEAAAAAANRPTHIVVHLLRDGVEVESRTVTAVTDWAYSFGEQPVDDGYGNLYTYTVREDGVPGFFSRVDGLNLINTLITVPQTTVRRGGNVPTRKTNTPAPPFQEFSEEQMDEYMDMLDYGTPLWGQLLGTGDETPVYPYVFAGVGALAIIALVVFGRKRRKKEK